MIDMYKKELKVCPKCNTAINKFTSKRYIKRNYVFFKKFEYMERRCFDCFYTWGEPCADTPVEEPLPNPGLY